MPAIAILASVLPFFAVFLGLHSSKGVEVEYGPKSQQVNRILKVLREMSIRPKQSADFLPLGNSFESWIDLEVSSMLLELQVAKCVGTEPPKDRTVQGQYPARILKPFVMGLASSALGAHWMGGAKQFQMFA